MPWTTNGGEPLGSVAARAEAAWASAVAAVAEERAGGGTGCILLIADQLTIAAIIRRALVRCLLVSIHAVVSRNSSSRRVPALPAAAADDAGPLPTGCVRADGAVAERGAWLQRSCQRNQQRRAPQRPSAHAAAARAMASGMGCTGLGSSEDRWLMRPRRCVLESRSRGPAPATLGGPQRRRRAAPAAATHAPAWHLGCAARPSAPRCHVGRPTRLAGVCA